MITLKLLPFTLAFIFTGLSAFAKSVPPQSFYHFGKFEYLDQDAKIDSIPDFVWKEFIMGKKSTYNLTSSRKGLYGGTEVSSISEFAHKLFPWVMKVHISDDCRKEEHVTDLTTVDQTLEFQNWFEKLPLGRKEGFLSHNDFSKKCILRDSEKLMLAIAAPQKGDQIRETDLQRSCNQIFNSFIGENQKFLIVDHEVPNSWYIRNIKCIEKIDGEADEMYSMILEDTSLLFENEHIGEMLLRSIAHSKDIEHGHIDYIYTLIKDSSVSENPIARVISGLFICNSEYSIKFIKSAFSSVLKIMDGERASYEKKETNKYQELSFYIEKLIQLFKAENDKCF